MFDFEVDFNYRTFMVMGLALIDLVLWAKVSFWAMILAMGVQFLIVGVAMWVNRY